MSNNTPLKPLYLLSDEPIDSHKSDHLEMTTFRDVITGTVLGTVGPFTIGVYGKWGEGKSSLLRAAESRLRAHASEATATPALEAGEPEFPYVVPVWFNPWQYESEDHPLVPLVAEIERAVATALLDEAGILKRYGPTTVKILKGIGLAGLSLLRSASIKGTVEVGVPLLAKGSVGIGLDGKNFVEGLEKAWEHTQKEQKSQWQTLVDQSTYLTIFDRLRAVYHNLDSVRPGPEKRIPRIAVFIDDLDRCQPDKAFELIEAIKLVLGQRGFIFILALDKSIVDAYVETLWKDRLKDRYGQEAARYLDKIVQLPLYLRKHDRCFGPFVSGLLKKMRDAGVPDDTMQVFEGAKDHLGKATDFGPRALVRRINTLLVDQKLRPPPDAKDSKEVRDLTPAQFLGLCLVQRTLLDHLDHAVVLAMAQNDGFCHHLAKLWREAQDRQDPDIGDPVSAMYAHLEKIREMREPKADRIDVAGRAITEPTPEDPKHKAWRDFLFKLDPHAPCEYVLGTDHGQRWLSSRALRDLVTHFVADRPVEIAPADAAGGAAAPPVGSGAAPLLDDTPELREQIALIERKVRFQLDLSGNAPLDAAAWGRVELLSLTGEPITDKGVSWLARPDSGLTGLKTLGLWNTKVTDEGVRTLASPYTSLKHITCLGLWMTEVTDNGVKHLAHPDTGLKSLTSLDIRSTKITDASLRQLASVDTGLQKLSELILGDTTITDSGVTHLALANTALSGLTSLFLHATKITDTGVKALARSDTGVKALKFLNLGGTNVTDAGVEALASPNTGLRALSTLHLGGTRITDAGVAQLARPSTALSALSLLILSDTQVTDAGVKQLARSDGGLIALSQLDLAGTKVTDAGIAALASTDTGLTRLAVLNLEGTEVTNAGIRAFRARFPGITVFA